MLAGLRLFLVDNGPLLALTKSWLGVQNLEALEMRHIENQHIWGLEKYAQQKIAFNLPELCHVMIVSNAEENQPADDVGDGEDPGDVRKRFSLLFEILEILQIVQI